MWWSRRAFLSVAIVPLAGCGFHPLYSRAQLADDEPLLASIKVAPISNRIGQQLEFSLRESLNPRGLRVEQRYILSVTLSVSETDLGIQRDATATFGELAVSASFVLQDSKTGQRVYSSRTSTIGSFNLPNDAYAAQIADDDARARTVQELSDEIGARLVLFLRQKRAG